MASLCTFPILAILAITCVFCYKIKVAKNHVFIKKIKILSILLFLVEETKVCSEFGFSF